MGGDRLAVLNPSGLLNKIRFEAWFGQGILFLYLCAVVTVASLVLGGGAGRGLLSDAILQLLAIPLLIVSLWRIFEIPLTGQMRPALWFCLAIAVLPLLQLIPLPPSIWTALPNRQPSVEAFDLLGRAIPWMPLSVSPKATWLSALSLVPPLAVFLSTLLLSYRERRLLLLVIFAVGVLSVFIGFLQVAQGEASSLRFFEYTSKNEAVGFFANRNLFAALLYCLIVFAIGWTIPRITDLSGPRNQMGKQNQKGYEYNTASITAMIVGFTLLVILLAGELMARSRAGLGLTMLALFGVFALGFVNRRAGFGALASKLLIGAVVLVAIFSLQFALYRVFDRIPDPLAGGRSVMASTTIEAARAYMPLGSGMGTFVPVYAMFEKPQDAEDTYVNRAHNDILEVWLESGLLGLAIGGMFVIWLVLRSVEIWRREPASGASQLDWSLIRAATIVPALLLIHSLVDFPLRTGANLAIMAFACALLIEPPIGASKTTEEAKLQVPRRTRNRDRRGLEPVLSSTKLATKPNLPSPSHPTSQSPSHPTSQRWGADFKWPKEWSKETPASNAEEKAPEKPASGTKTPESSAGATEADPPMARVMTNSTAASPNSGGGRLRGGGGGGFGDSEQLWFVVVRQPRYLK